MLFANRMIPYQAELDLKRMKPGMVLCIKYQLWCMLQYVKERPSAFLSHDDLYPENAFMRGQQKAWLHRGHDR